jgi:hypothetical protein
MSIPYCSLHARLFSIARGQWVDCAPEKIRPLKEFYALLRLANIEASTYCVIEGHCDCCAEAVPQVSRDPSAWPLHQSGVGEGGSST